MVGMLRTGWDLRNVEFDIPKFPGSYVNWRHYIIRTALEKDNPGREFSSAISEDAL
jgi:hypothetical protein